MTSRLGLLAHWSVCQKLNRFHFGLVQLRRSVRALTTASRPPPKLVLPAGERNRVLYPVYTRKYRLHKAHMKHT